METSKPIIMELKEIVKQLRGNKTQKEFARFCDVSHSTLSKIETGKKTPSNDFLMKLSNHKRIPSVFLKWYKLSEDKIPSNKRKLFRATKPIVDKLVKSYIK